MTEKELCRAIAILCDVYVLTDMSNKEYLRHIENIETQHTKSINSKKQ
tara:strand:+ start:267 stop:410 length:144 start_codon:yes stop_codon:yes gene_type:complete